MSGNPLKGRQIVLGVTGSIAAFKAVALASELVKRGGLVDVVMTPAATKFVTPLSFYAITHRPVITDLFDPQIELEIGHVTLGERAELMIVAPASANTIAKLALGLADDPLTTTALATRAPLLIAPAMETAMFDHPATQAHLQRLIERGSTIVGPASGRLASGREGRGRMVEPADIVQAAEAILAREQDLAGRRIVVTAGGTREPIDPVRYISNRSSGRMGYAVAQAARDRGAAVTLVSASTLPPPAGVKLVQVETALEMQQAVEAATADADILIMAAAVADFRPARPSERKIKKDEADLTLELVRNPDILASLKNDRLVKVGFAAETDNLLTNARKKIAEKGLAMIVANDVTAPDSGFEVETNRVTIIDRTGQAHQYPLMSKRQVADLVLDHIVESLPAR